MATDINPQSIFHLPLGHQVEVPPIICKSNYCNGKLQGKSMNSPFDFTRNPSQKSPVSIANSEVRVKLTSGFRMISQQSWVGILRRSQVIKEFAVAYIRSVCTVFILCLPLPGFIWLSQSGHRSEICYWALDWVAGKLLDIVDWEPADKGLGNRHSHADRRCMFMQAVAWVSGSSPYWASSWVAFEKKKSFKKFEKKFPSC